MQLYIHFGIINHSYYLIWLATPKLVCDANCKGANVEFVQNVIHGIFRAEPGRYYGDKNIEK